MTYPRAALNGQPTILLTATENTATLGKMGDDYYVDILLHKASHYTCISFHSGKQEHSSYALWKVIVMHPTSGFYGDHEFVCNQSPRVGLVSVVW